MDIDAFKEIVKDCCVDSDEDIVGLFWIVQEVERASATGDNVMSDTLIIVQALLANGMVAGDSPYIGDGYKPWADQAPTSVVERIKREWLALGRQPNIPDIVWFGPGPERLRQAAGKSPSQPNP